MSLKDTTDRTLQHLFQHYLENPNGIVDIQEVLSDQTDPHELGKYLKDHGWVKNQQYIPLTFRAQITMQGILQVAPEYIEENMDRIISYIGLQGGGRHYIMEILDWEPQHFQRAFDLVKYMETLGVIKPGMYEANNIIIELSLKGMDYYEKNEARFE